jgi:hypothetical protein
LPRRKIRVLAWLPLFFLYVLVYSTNNPLSGKNLTVYGDTRESYLLLCCLLILGMIILWPARAETESKNDNGALKYWFLSFFLFFVSMLSVTVFINPHGRFPWNPYPFTTTAAPFQKAAIYEKTEYNPRLIVFGSSRAYTISAEYLTTMTGEPAFNMAVGAAGPVDELVLARYIVENSREVPRLFLVEMAATDLDTIVWQTTMPLNLLPYLPGNGVAPVLDSIFIDTLSLRSLTDSFYLLSYRDAREYISFLTDGTGIRMGDRGRNYQENVNKQIPPVYEENTCTNLDQGGMEAIENLVILSEKNKIGLIFYRSPLNVEFFKHVNLENVQYKQCQLLLDQFMISITDSHPNVFYVDLMRYEPVSLLREKGYIDVQHLLPDASNMVIDALLPAIEDGLTWVRVNRDQ